MLGPRGCPRASSNTESKMALTAGDHSRGTQVRTISIFQRPGHSWRHWSPLLRGRRSRSLRAAYSSVPFSENPLAPAFRLNQIGEGNMRTQELDPMARKQEKLAASTLSCLSSHALVPVNKAVGKRVGSCAGPPILLDLPRGYVCNLERFVTGIAPRLVLAEVGNPLRP